MGTFRVKYRDEKNVVCISRIKAENAGLASVIAKGKYRAVKILEVKRV